MTRTRALDEVCTGLFAGYPSAITTFRHGNEIIQSLVLMVLDGQDISFFTLSRHPDRPSLTSWGDSNARNVDSDGYPNDSEDIADILTRGIPLPRHGSLFGWASDGCISALTAFYANPAPPCKPPSWTVMPLVGTPETRWPPFTNEPVFGRWFWQYYKAGKVINLGRLISETPCTVFWAATKGILGSDCCVVAHDIESPEGLTLPRGRYVYSEALQEGKTAPSLDTLLADDRKVDLSSRFQRSAYCKVTV
jgi:hypothetical protein